MLTSLQTLQLKALREQLERDALLAKRRPWQDLAAIVHIEIIALVPRVLLFLDHLINNEKPHDDFDDLLKRHIDYTASTSLSYFSYSDYYLNQHLQEITRILQHDEPKLTANLGTSTVANLIWGASYNPSEVEAHYRDVNLALCELFQFVVQQTDALSVKKTLSQTAQFQRQVFYELMTQMYHFALSSRTNQLQQTGLSEQLLQLFDLMEEVRLAMSAIAASISPNVWNDFLRQHQALFSENNKRAACCRVVSMKNLVPYELEQVASTIAEEQRLLDNNDLSCDNPTRLFLVNGGREVVDTEEFKRTLLSADYLANRHTPGMQHLDDLLIKALYLLLKETDRQFTLYFTKKSFPLYGQFFAGNSNVFVKYKALRQLFYHTQNKLHEYIDKPFAEQWSYLLGVLNSIKRYLCTHTSSYSSEVSLSAQQWHAFIYDNESALLGLYSQPIIDELADNVTIHITDRVDKEVMIHEKDSASTIRVANSH